jgi:hypothetical protein
MCCKIVKRLTVDPHGEYSNKPSVKSRTHKLFVALPGNKRYYLFIYLFMCMYVCIGMCILRLYKTVRCLFSIGTFKKALQNVYVCIFNAGLLARSQFASGRSKVFCGFSQF